MTMTTISQGGPFLRPEEVGKLLHATVGGLSVALLVSKGGGITTGATAYRIPVINTDAEAGWFAEGVEITPSDAVTSELVVIPSKVAGLTIISNELAADSSPEATAEVGDGLARDIARKIDKALFSIVAAPAPNGLAAVALVTGTAVEAAASFTTLDAFAGAISAAEARGAVIDSFVTSPAEALALAKLKDQTGSNRPLLGVDPTQPTKRTIYGVPLRVNPDIAVKTVWAIPSDRTYVIVRLGSKVDIDKSAYFSSDRTGVRGVMRVGFGFPDPLSIIKITHA
jgi:HK97 family phage major capsid protein